MDSHNSETFSGIFGSVDERRGGINRGEGNDGAHTLATFSPMVPSFCYLIIKSVGLVIPNNFLNHIVLCRSS